jgi:carbamoyltransferase
MGIPRRTAHPFSPFLGRRYQQDDIEDAFVHFGLSQDVKKGDVIDIAAQDVSQGKLLCWVQGRSEWGPRALGARSIVADPTRDGISDHVNNFLKFREPFRPFAIFGTYDALAELVDLSAVPKGLQSLMLGVAKIRDARLAPVRHADGTIRIQVVDPDLHQRWYQLIESFAAARGIGVVLNTSFNTLGEPLVETPRDAVRQFLLCGADRLVIEDYAVERGTLKKSVESQAVRIAWSETIFDPLSMALSLEQSGYPDKAIATLNAAGNVGNATAFDTDREIAFCALMIRWAHLHCLTGQARFYAEAMLKQLRLPADAIWAAKTLMESTSQQDIDTGIFLGALAERGSVARFCGSVFGRRDHASDQST